MSDDGDDKRRHLLAQGALNPRADRVRAPLFAEESGFFDKRDVVQVKYEMLRRVRLDGSTVSSAAADHGLSRVAFYQALAAFQREGLSGLLPRKRGPRQGHKLTNEVLDFIGAQLASDASLDAVALARLVRKRFRRSVHPRTIERALTKKKRP